MLSVRSKSMAEYAVRLLFVILLGLAIHCAVASARGGGKSAFDFNLPERRRSILMVVLVVGAVAVVMLPTAAVRKPAKADGERVKSASGEPLPPAATQSEPPVAPPASEPSPPVAPTDAEPSQPIAPSIPAPSIPAPSQPASSPVERSTIVERSAPTVSARVDVPQVRSAEPAPAPQTSAEGDALAVEMSERMWRSARKIRHNYIPDRAHDGEYLNLLHGAAMSGHSKAQAKLSDYAFRRGALVEAYYWMKLAQMNGYADAESNLKIYRDQWRRSAYPLEYENVYEHFTERQGSLGRALLRLDSGVQADQAKKRLTSMAAEGEAVAVMILGEMPEGGDA